MRRTLVEGARGWRVRVALLALLAAAVATVWVTNLWLSERFTETVRNRAEVRQALYAGNLLSELRRNAVVPQLLARDPALIGALASGDFSQSTRRLISFVDEIGAASLMMLDRDGRAVAVTQRHELGALHRNAPYTVAALRSNDTVFTMADSGNGTMRFFYSRRIAERGRLLGVIVVEVDLRKFERSWTGISEAVLVTDSEGRIILSTEPRWRGLTLDEALTVRSPPSAIERAIRATADWTTLPADAYLRGQAVLRNDSRIPFRGWTMTTFTAYASVRERVNGVLALQIMGFAILAALTFYLAGRRTQSRLRFIQRESAELRALNDRLQQEIAEREKVEKTLEVAEQTLAQSSKLAALGEMSAAVSHELNQPLAAMRTYLAGARLLMQRRRAEEAIGSLQRIDDLIERMGTITRQLKSYARKGDERFEPVDLRESVSAALAMMEPQLRRRHVTITQTLPQGPAMVVGEKVRLEQVIVNLLRNALDATRETAEPRVELLVARGETVRLTVRDNGQGIADLESLFEPFYTTKQPGDGVGLGLAISSGIVKELGGRLTARNGATGGAVFEVHLPRHAPADGDAGPGSGPGGWRREAAE